MISHPRSKLRKDANLVQKHFIGPTNSANVRDEKRSLSASDTSTRTPNDWLPAHSRTLNDWLQDYRFQWRVSLLSASGSGRYMFVAVIEPISSLFAVKDG